MRKICGIFLTVILMITMISSAVGAGYTLPEKLELQLLVGSGLKGSFVIQTNADPVLNPLVHSVRNTLFEIRGISYEGNQHYYFYQSEENEKMKALTEYCKIDGRGFLRSDFLGESCFLLPTEEQLINSWLKSEGENPSIFPDLLRALFSNSEADAFSTEGLERQVEMWISSFSTETSVQSGTGSPKLTQTFRIPLSDLYKAVTELIRTVTTNEAYLSYFQSILSKEQIDTYLNPELGYYYIEAMEQLNMEGDVLFSRTVSTMGELIQSSLILPMDADKTGYTSATFKNSVTRKSVFFSGPRGVLYIELPSDFNLKDENISDAEIHFALIDNENEEKKNLALKIVLSKVSDRYEDTEESRVHEKEKYTVSITRETEGLPEEINVDSFPEMASADMLIEIHYSSKPQPSSPTTVEFSFKVLQGQYDFDLTGILKTASPWVFSPFDVSGAIDAGSYTKEDFSKLLESWETNAEENLERTSEEEQTEESAELNDLDEHTEAAAKDETPADDAPDEESEPVGDFDEDHTEG